MTAGVRPALFRSFWIGGFESATHINRQGVRLDMLQATQHDRFVSEDYGRLPSVGIQTARDTVRWHLVEAVPGQYDFASLDQFLHAARRHQVEVIWNLMHYGWPADLDVYSGEFVRRFASFCGATVRYLRQHLPEARFFTPINEISFLSWAAGHVGWFHPFSNGRGDEIKRQFVRAWIAAAEAIWAENPDARLVSVEPLIHTVPPSGRPDRGGAARQQNESQWAAWEMISGRRAPELGGHPRYLDVIGVNFYHDNQWEVPGGQKIGWHLKPRDPRWVPFNRLLRGAYERWQRPILIAETSHVGSGRAEWIAELTDEVILAVSGGVPLEGLCLYPIIDRFDWDNHRHWHNSGLWDYAIQPDGSFQRVLNAAYATALRKAQARLAAIGFGEPRAEAAIGRP